MALLLALIMVIGAGTVASADSLSPKSNAAAHVYTEAEYKAIDDDVFALISSVKEDALQKKTYTEGESAYLTEADYIDLVPDVIKAVEASVTYVDGTLQQNGYFLVWETTTGIPCCYSPRMEAKLGRQGGHSEELAAIEEAALDQVLQPGSSASEINTALHSPSSTNIGLIQPYWESNSNYADYTFCTYSPSYKTMWQNLYGATGGQGIRYSMSNATIDNIARTMEQCGLVIFDSHGDTDYVGSNEDYTSQANSSYLCLTTSTGITSTDTKRKTGPYGNYYDAVYYYDGGVGVNGQCIANHMSTNAPCSLLYMGICLGMATDKMFEGLRAKGLEVAYGYSQSVSFYGERLYMQSILGHVKDGDTFAQAVAKAKASYGNWDPAYSDDTLNEAISNKAAFPITVSTEDPYPGHGNVDAIQTVYSTWTLYPSYTVTATSNNVNYGTVSVDGYTITASPKTGYYTAGYTVTQGNATVTQAGNTFTVHPTSDCTVRINFAAKTLVNITCYANGSVYQTLGGYANEPITLPLSAPEVNGWSFIGWSAQEIDEASANPGCYAPGSSIAVAANTQLYAMYKAYNGDVPAVTVYELVTEAPYDWSGDYVITNGPSAAYILKGISGNNVSYESANSGGVSTLAASGITLSGNTLYNVDDVYAFTFTSNGSSYTINNLLTGTYLASINNTLKSYSSLNDAYCSWTPSMNGAAVTLKNTASSRYPYLSFSSNGYFNINSTANSSIYLWRSTSGNYIYSTEPSTDEPPVDPPVNNVTVVSGPAGVFTEGHEYTVEGNVVTVTYHTPCKLGYLGEDGKYIAIEAIAVAGSDNTYNFTVPEGIDEVLLVIKGDANQDGDLTNLDITISKLVALGRQGQIQFNAENLFAADMSGDKAISNYDITLLKAFSLGKTPREW